ncbi:uncharacterized protein LOC117140209 [Drosophila mauritiana]|uniref:Uncharacterized protein LOC117140209 n=1 Tax=Drosophila mauritiana TaxID=7226 RepID=A0A6P8K304_DROMA|nr:uncharacterized protein LOC117140209 [Drosophila mauritiana]
MWTSGRMCNQAQMNHRSRAKKTSPDRRATIGSPMFLIRRQTTKNWVSRDKCEVSYEQNLLTYFGGDPSDPEEPPSQADRLLQRATDHPAQTASLGRLFDPIYGARWEVSDLLEHG